MTNWLRPTSFKRTLFFLVLDVLLSLLTLYFSYELRFNFHIPERFLGSFWLVFSVLAVLKLSSLYVFRSYSVIWRFFSFSDAKNIIKAHIAAYLFFVLIYVLFREVFNPFPRSVIIIDFFLSLIFIGTVRVAKRVWKEGRYTKKIKPTLIIGVNSKTGTMIQSALKEEIDYYPVAIISLDDDSSLHTYINNVKVYAVSDLESVIEEKKIVSAIITQTLRQKELKRLVEALNQAGINEIKQVRLLGGEHEKLEDLSIEDLLARHPQDLDMTLISSFIRGKSILITGAGGSIGSEITKQCQHFGAKALTLVDNSEFNLYQIGEEVKSASLKLVSVTDRESLETLFQDILPDIVIHAAAYKHVPICEENQASAVFNNVLGSKNVIDVSIACGVQKVVLISTDKAVRPTNVMGATKRVTELYASNVDAEETEIVAVRFGNVLGSSGSVIPKFKQQIEKGGPVTVTHPEITRYFMLIPEACQLVLQAAAMAKGGELFILDMGEPVKIVDLARQMVRLYGKEDEVEIVFTGLRPGEKLYEELLLDESEQKTKYSSIFIARPSDYDIEQLEEDIEVLLSTENKIEILQKIVPEFVHNDKGL
ncbi:polysaccharide biosynthesis protein [Sulfurovum sp. ST-21]|uniref:Polysaccharide biosynthesis protein n=1 Tax=Sulfurovum indicum TaxID=2779528 RepID=A0A7M1S361_9BACT|nr:nucleoside-diphosphate sugar epimerase/dehydratase [Sulfurovum indicum]QOR61798.1 polysaccharide biosynthesis protein [Sulfurovum indicum]